MMEILLVDDSERKVKRLKEVLAGYSERIAFSECHDIVSAKKILIEKQFDLVVLDIQLPPREGETPKAEGGIELLRELHSRACYKKPLCIVGLTQYTESLAQVESLFSDKLWSIVLFDDTNDAWAERLKRKVDYLLQFKACEALKASYQCDLAIITALSSPEFESVMRLAEWKPCPVKGDSSHYSEATFSTSQKSLKVIAACAPQMGMPAAAVLATKLISNFHPRYLAMIGITAGVKGEVELGDILVADPSWDWGSGKRRGSEDGFFLDPEPMPERLDPHVRALFMDVQRDSSLLSTVRALWPGEKPSTDLHLHIGPCASGACVLADGITIDDIKRHSRKLIGVEMETYAVMHAAANAIDPRPFAFSMKGVCDFGDKNKQDVSQAYAAFATANLLHRIALKYF